MVNFYILGARHTYTLLLLTLSLVYSNGVTMKHCYFFAVSDGTYGEEYHRPENREQFQPVEQQDRLISR